MCDIEIYASFWKLSTPWVSPSNCLLFNSNYGQSVSIILNVTGHRRLVKGTWSINQNHNNFRKNQKSIAQLLRDEGGYNTGIFGKWHLGGRVPPSGVVDRDRILSSNSHDWTLPLGDGPNDIGFDASYISAEGIQNPPYAFFRNGLLDMDIGTERYWKYGNYNMTHGQSKIISDGEGSKNWDSTAYNIILVNETENFIDKHLQEKPSDPFFAYVALGSVHIPHSPPDYYIDGTPIATQYSSSYFNMLFEMDKVVGSLVDMIEARGIQEDTIIIFTSDNGGLNGQNFGTTELHSSSGELRGSKGMIYEGGHRVPMIWRHDSVLPQGEQRTHLLGLNDIFATLCEIAGVPVPAKSSARDSISFADYLLSETNTDKLRENLGHWRFKGKKFETASLRKNNMKVIQNYINSTVELYDLDVDLSETNDLSSNAVYSDLITEMLSTLAKIGPCPPNKKNKFNVVVNSQTKQKRCKWIARKRKQRCKQYGKIARKNCPFTCSRHNKFCETIV